MKLKEILFFSMVMLAGSLQAIERYYVVKVTDMIGSVEYKVMNDEEYNTANKEVQDEIKIFTAVVTDCKKEWKEDPAKEGDFAASKIKARKIIKGGATFPTKEKAEAKLDRLMEGVTEDRLAELDKNAKMFKGMDDKMRAREEVKLNAFKQSFEMVSKKMEEKLGRKVPDFGFDLVVPNPDAKH